MMNSVRCVIDSCDVQISASDTNSLRNHLCVHLNYYPFGCGYCIENGRKDCYFATETSLINHTKSHHTAKETKIFEDVNETKEQRLRELIAQMSVKSHMTPEKQRSDQSRKRALSYQREELQMDTLRYDDRCLHRKKQKLVSNVPSSAQKVPTPGKRPAKARKSISPRKSPNKFPFLSGQKLLSDFYAPKSTTSSASTVDTSTIGPNEAEQPAQIGTKDEFHKVSIETLKKTVHSPANLNNTPALHRKEQKANIPVKTHSMDDIPKIQCKKCSRNVKIFDLYLHLLAHTAKPLFECNACQCSYRSYPGAQRHIDRHHPGKITTDFRCEEAQEELDELWFSCYGIVDKRMSCEICHKNKSVRAARMHVEWHRKKLTGKLSFGQVAYKCFARHADLLSGKVDLHNPTAQEPEEEHRPVSIEERESPSDPPTSTLTIQSVRDISDSGKLIPPPEANEATTETDSPHLLPTPDSAETFEGLNCMKCNQSVALDSLCQHLLNHTEGSSYECVPCSRAWRHATGVQHHINTKHPGETVADFRSLSDEELTKLTPECYGVQKLFCTLCNAEKSLSIAHRHVVKHLKSAQYYSTYAQVAYDCFGHHNAPGPRQASPEAPRPSPSPQHPPDTSILAAPPPLEPDHNENAADDFQTLPVLICSLCSIPTAEPEWHVFQCHMQMRQYPFQCAMCEFKAVTPDAFPKHYQLHHSDLSVIELNCKVLLLI